jgi:putative ABC transport system ATP-binding protein
MPLIELRDASKDYHLGETIVHALCDVNLSVEAGEFVAIWGPSGSGKSTLCNLIGIVDRATDGTVLINGRDVDRLSDDACSDHRNRSIGFIFQRFNLLPVLDTVENVMLPLQIGGAPPEEARRRALEMIGAVGLAEFAANRPDKLSGGQQQRVAIARALVARPPIVIADEPTANLDSENATRIVDLMREFNRTLGTTFIFSTHDQRLLERVARRVRLRDGRVVEDVRSPSAEGRTPC